MLAKIHLKPTNDALFEEWKLASQVPEESTRLHFFSELVANRLSVREQIMEFAKVSVEQPNPLGLTFLIKKLKRDIGRAVETPIDEEKILSSVEHWAFHLTLSPSLDSASAVRLLAEILSDAYEDSKAAIRVKLLLRKGLYPQRLQELLARSSADPSTLKVNQWIEKSSDEYRALLDGSLRYWIEKASNLEAKPSLRGS